MCLEEAFGRTKDPGWPKIITNWKATLHGWFTKQPLGDSTYRVGLAGGAGFLNNN